MKRTFLSLLVLSAGFIVSYAQPTLTASTNSPVVGERFIGHICDTTGVTTGASGASVTWNYSTLTETGRDTVAFYNCLSTPRCDSFPTSNIVSYDGTSYSYEISATDSFYTIGYYSSGTVARIYDPSRVLIYPFTYPNSYTDRTTYSGTSTGITDYGTINTTTTADAWGALTIPSGTYSSTVRVHVITVTKDSLVIGGFPYMVTSARVEDYIWYTTGFHYQLLDMTYDTAGSTSQYLSQVKYNTQAPPLSVSPVIQANDAFLEVYPNPASELIKLRLNVVGNNASVVITDLLGRKVYSISGDKLATGVNNITIPVSSFPRGLYVVRVQSTAGCVTQKVTIQ